MIFVLPFILLLLIDAFTFHWNIKLISHSLAHASHVFCLLLTLLSSLPNRRSAITVATHGETRPPRPTFPPHPSTKFPASVRGAFLFMRLDFIASFLLSWFFFFFSRKNIADLFLLLFHALLLLLLPLITYIVLLFIWFWNIIAESDSQVLVILIFHTCPSLHSAYPLVKKIDISFSC